MSYFKNIFTTGAISKTPRRVLKRITDEANPERSALIIELGAGKGEITKNIIAKAGTRPLEYFAFEIHKEFSGQLKTEFPTIHVLEEDALHFDQFVKAKADLIICSLPLSFFPKKDRITLLEKIRLNTRPGGKAIILFHAPWLISLLKSALPGSKLIRIFNLPPYYITIYSPVN